MEALGFGPFSEWEAWLQFLGWRPEYAEVLAAIDWAQVAESVVDRFYAQVKAMPALDALVVNATTYEALQRSLAQYIARLADPPVGRSYLQAIYRIAAEHVRIGLGPDWYMAAYRWLWTATQGQICRQLPGDPGRQQLWFEAASCRLMADMVLTVALYDQVRREEAYRDPLTQALSRAGHREWLARQLRRSSPSGLVVALDIDDFKWVNDTWGHFAGDAILSELVARLTRVIRPDDAVVRTGGDEFVVWLQGIEPGEAERVAARLHAAATELPYVVEDTPIQIGVSLGYATGTLGEETARLADDALLTAKRTGKNRMVASSVIPQGSPPPTAPTPGLGWLVSTAEAFWRLWPYPAFLTDRQGVILAVNPAFCEESGWRVEEVVGQPSRILGAGKTPKRVYAELWERLSQGKPWHGVLENQRRDGSPWWSTETIAPVVLGSRIVGYWATLTDLLGVRRAPPPLQASILDGTQLSFHFQPIWDLAAGTCLGYEALVRPMRDGTPLTPQQLFAIAERAGDVVTVDLACLKALRALLDEQGGWPAEAGRLWINVRPETVADPAAWASAHALWAEFGPSRVVWEIGEQGTRGVDRERWQDLGSRGLTLALDDFGVGDTDWPRLMRSHPRWVKFDRTVVRDLPQGARERALIQHLVQWAHAFDVRCVAEGVETWEEWQAAAELGIDAGQGFLLGRPGPWPQEAGRSALRLTPPR